MELFIALLPLVVLVSLVLFLRKSITFAVSGALLTLMLAVVYWGTELSSVSGATVRGILLATEIIIVIFSAVLIFEILERNKLFNILLQLLQKISRDKVVQTLFVLSGVVVFMEGVAGFGTPAIIAIPLLLSIGYTPIQSVILSLLADSVPVSFGAIGLPITFGVDSVISTIEGANSDELLQEIITQTALINIAGYVLLGVFLLLAIKKFSKSPLRIMSYLPLVISTALTIGATSLVTAVYIGPELASIIGGLAGMLSIAYFSKLSWLSPLSQPTEALEEIKINKKLLIKAVLPYTILVVLLLVTRLPAFGLRELLSNYTIEFNSIFGGQISYQIAPLFSAATILLFTALFSLFWFSESKQATKSIVSSVFRTVYKPFIALLLTLVFVQIFINTASIDYASMPIIIAQSLSNLVGEYWILFSPFIGVLGSFLSGSATVSNLIFTGIQYDVAVETLTEPASVLSMQSVGAALGNMIALHNIVAALAIAKLHSNSSHVVIRQNGKYLVLILLAVALVGIIIQ